MLSSVALINRALESGDMSTVWRQLSSSVTGLTNIEEENCQRWVPGAVAESLDGGRLCPWCVSRPVFFTDIVTSLGSFFFSYFDSCYSSLC